MRTTKANRSQKGQEVPSFTEDEARAYFEKLRWPNGAGCVHCGSVNVYLVGGKSHRPGLYECRDCREQFTVTTKSVMEDTHLKLSIWAKAFHLMCSSKKGVSALQLQRELGLGSYKTAWFLAHRIREAMRCAPLAGMLKGDVQVDETYIGPSRAGKRRGPNDPPRKHGRGTTKQPVLALVETSGKVHSLPIARIDGKTLRNAMRDCIDPSSRIITDELPAYPKAAAGFAGGHQTVNHSQGEYVRASDGLHTNTAESYFALLKRGLHGAFHHVSKKHLHRYCDEFSFRWNGRFLTDSERRNEAVQGGEGKRLMYKQPKLPPPPPPAPGEQLLPFPL
jgi:transposase-like protein